MIHVVQPGESFSAIAAAYGLTTRQLLDQNLPVDTERLVVGQALLVLQPALVHTVQAGDTLYRLAQIYGLSVRQLYQRNPQLLGMPAIWPGQQLVIRYAEQNEAPLLVTGYGYPFIDRSLLRSVLPSLSTIKPFTYGFTSNGELVPIDDEEMLRMAQQAGSGAVMVLAPLTSEGMFDSNLASELFASPEATGNLISNTVNLARIKGYDGVNLDFEYIRREDSASYVRFTAELARQLHKEGRILSVALAPKVSAEQRGQLYEGHDYRALGMAADFAMLMTYEWGYTYGPPLAIAPTYEVRRVLEYGLSEIPAQKILMGIPNYGYDWTLPYRRGAAAVTISNQRAVELAWLYETEIRYDQAAQAPYIEYTTPEGARHIVWFEDVRSISAKLDLAAEFGLRGISYWTVNRPFPANWLLVTTRFAPEPMPVYRGYLME